MKNTTQKIIKIEICLTKTDIKFLKKLGFKSDLNPDFDAAILFGEGVSNEKMADKMCELGIFQYVVSSWGYEEHEYYLTEVGQQVLKNINY